MNNHLNILLFVASSTLLLASCGESNKSYETPNTSGVATNSGVISQKNFSLLTADINPGVIDATTNIFTQTDVELTVYIGDRNNQTLTDAHTVNFETEYGLIEPSCVTENGSCSVTWKAIKRPDAGGPGSDGIVSITAYTSGEEAFTDTNGNGLFDDGDAGFEDLEEPYVDANEDNVYAVGDGIIDVVSTSDPTGANNIHDAGDSLFNGGNCTHTSQCGATSLTIFDGIRMNLITNIPLERTVGGNVTGLAGAGLVLENIGNNGTDNLSISADGAYTFATTVTDGSTYTASVLTQPTTPTQVCNIANNTGTVSANVTTADVTCVTNTYTIGGNVTGLAGTGLQLTNGAEILSIDANGAYTFATPIDDTDSYSVVESTQPSGLSQTCTAINKTGGPGVTADVTNVDVNCVTDTFTISGTVTGIPATESIVIHNNANANSDDITLTNADNGILFTFTTAIEDGLNYAVTIFSMTAVTAPFTCTLASDTGTLMGNDVTDVTITCP